MSNNYDPMAIGGGTPDAPVGHNSGGENPGSEKDAIFKAIESLYEEATHWADGTDIENVQQHDAVTAIREAIHELGKKADVIRVAEKEPHTKAADAVQAEFNPYIQAKKGKVDRAKKCLDDVLARWRIAEQKRKDEAAKAERERAEAELAAATRAIRESSGNLLAREDAEAQLEDARKATRAADRAEKQANTGTGLRTVRSMTLPEENREKGMDWAFGHDPEAFFRLAVDMAAEYHSITKKVAPGFEIVERKVAR